MLKTISLEKLKLLLIELFSAWMTENKPSYCGSNLKMTQIWVDHQVQNQRFSGSPMSRLVKPDNVKIPRICLTCSLSLWELWSTVMDVLSFAFGRCSLQSLIKLWILHHIKECFKTVCGKCFRPSKQICFGKTLKETGVMKCPSESKHFKPFEILQNGPKACCKWSNFACG